MKYVVEVYDGIETHACEVTNLYDKFNQSTIDPDKAVSGVIRLAPNQYLNFDALITGVYTVH